MSALLQIQGVTRRFGSVVANDDVSLSVSSGQVVGLLGHNGAGKTTLVSQVLGLLRPDSGKIQVVGIDAVAHPGKARTVVAAQSQSQAPIDGLTPRQAIWLSARLRGASRSHAKQVATELAEELDIAQWLDQRALPEGRGLSGGIRRLAAFGMAVAVPAPVIILDEPTNDIDPARRRRLWDAVRRRADDGAGVLLVTHNVVEAERVLDQVVVMNRGRVVANGTPGELLPAVGGHDDPASSLEQVYLRLTGEVGGEAA
ncbi:ABC transporter ATP-binding protein [Kocuria sp.]|uniref:ABC transporter ATP-binding protein n=1 Tax=Kocuria sp. TaxID=1871328 RepID=UPI0026DFCD1D|nr:ABC transporter ATP-binding protein [Kocuria sp.]MDO5618247.1 ABC transporter ATP-binding protein [Kocuria sp.]